MSSEAAQRTKETDGMSFMAYTGISIDKIIDNRIRARREKIATAAMQGLLAHGCPPLKVAGWAVAHADALIARLDKPSTDNDR